jgi:hypothetical protein
VGRAPIVAARSAQGSLLMMPYPLPHAAAAARRLIKVVFVVQRGDACLKGVRPSD